MNSIEYRPGGVNLRVVWITHGISPSAFGLASHLLLSPADMPRESKIMIDNGGLAIGSLIVPAIVIVPPLIVTVVWLRAGATAGMIAAQAAAVLRSTTRRRPDSCIVA